MTTHNATLQSSLEAAMNELGGELGTTLSFDHQHICVFRYLSDLDVAIQLFPDDGRVTFAAVLKNELDPATPGLFSLLTMFNWMGVQTRGGTLCFNDETRSVVLWRDPVGTRWDGAELKVQLEDFIGLAIDMRETLEEGLATLPEALTQTQPQPAALVSGRYA
jgi:hypothetical protein